MGPELLGTYCNNTYPQCAEIILELTEDLPKTFQTFSAGVFGLIATKLGLEWYFISFLTVFQILPGGYTENIQKIFHTENIQKIFHTENIQTLGFVRLQKCG